MCIRDRSATISVKALAQVAASEPLVCKKYPFVPPLVGQSTPSSMTLPDPLGVIGILPLLADIIPLLFTSKSPPS